MSAAIEILTLHEDAFYEYFVPYRHPSANHDIWGGIGLETFGSDLEIVRDLDKQFLWTVVDGGAGGDVWIVPGFHLVNRICYLVTKRPHGWIPVQFKVPGSLNSLTAIGLVHQLKQIDKLARGSRSMI